jgi:hypothetical protein
VAAIFFRLLTDEAREANQPRQEVFLDVKPGSWYYNAISVMEKMQIVHGYPSELFKPNEAITRAELAAIAARIASQTEMLPVSAMDFADVADHWAMDAIRHVTEIGWVNSYTDGTFRPDADLTRAEFITLVNRMLERAPETVEDILSDEMITWADNADPGAWYYLAIQEATNSHVSKYKDKTVQGFHFQYEQWVEMMENRE